VLAPDINESRSDFTPVGEKIRFGLAAVKNVGEKAVEVILQSRERDGSFESLFDFCRRVDLTAVNRRVIESLIKCGAFDSTQVSRARMFAALDEAIRAGQAYQRDQQSNQIDIFAVLGNPGKAKRSGDLYPQVEEWTQQESLAFEKEALGFYITGHPLDKYDRVIKKITGGTIAALKEKAAPGQIKVGGVVSALKLRNTKKGERYGNFNLEDKTGFIEVIAWPDVYRKCMEILGRDDPIFVTGKLEVGEDRIQIIANEIHPLAEVAAKARANGNGKANGNGEKLHLYARESEVCADDFVQLRHTLLDYPGPCTVFLHLLTDNKIETVIELPEQVRVAPTPELEKSVSKLLGSRIVFHSLEF
jgi:DNA polymerase-3 subunit alpha